MCSVQLRLRVRGGPRASARGRGGAGREAGPARDWQGWPARSRARLRARGRQPWGGVHGQNNVRPLEGPEGGALPLTTAVGGCGASCLPEQLPGWGWGRSGYHLGGAPESTALRPRSPPGRLRFSHRKGFLLLRRGRAGSRGARSAPCWIGVYAGVSAQAVENTPSLPCGLAPLFWSMPTPAWLHMFWPNLRKHNLRKNRKRGGRSDRFGLEFRCLRTKPLA